VNATFVSFNVVPSSSRSKHEIERREVLIARRRLQFGTKRPLERETARSEVVALQLTPVERRAQTLGRVAQLDALTLRVTRVIEMCNTRTMQHNILV
jgi:hypothetical protein